MKLRKIRMSGMNKNLNVLQLPILIQDHGHIQSMSTIEAGILRRRKLPPLNFGVVHLPGLVLILMEMEM